MISPEASSILARIGAAEGDSSPTGQPSSGCGLAGPHRTRGPACGHCVQPDHPTSGDDSDPPSGTLMTSVNHQLRGIIPVRHRRDHFQRPRQESCAQFDDRQSLRAWIRPRSARSCPPGCPPRACRADRRPRSEINVNLANSYRRHDRPSRSREKSSPPGHPGQWWTRSRARVSLQARAVEGRPWATMAPWGCPSGRDHPAGPDPGGARASASPRTQRCGYSASMALGIGRVIGQLTAGTCWCRTR
jgi:hypothetical protein